MTENMQADVQQSRQAVFAQCCLNINTVALTAGEGRTNLPTA
jgi:hypothetical protein